MKEQILKLYPEYDTIYGPYPNNVNRPIIILYSTITHKRKTVSYPKILMEIKLDRILGKNETVDHIDEDFNNNDYSNLQILTRAENAAKSAWKLPNDVIANCKWCDQQFLLSKNQMNERTRKKQKAGPFCSKRCTGLYGSNLRSGGPKIDRQMPDIELYRLTDLKGT